MKDIIMACVGLWILLMLSGLMIPVVIEQWVDVLPKLHRFRAERRDFKARMRLEDRNRDIRRAA